MLLEPESIVVDWKASGRLEIEHRFDCVNCADSTNWVEYRVEPGVLTIVENSEAEEAAGCVCYLFSSYTLTDVPPGKYRVKIIKKLPQSERITFATDVELLEGKDESLRKPADVIDGCELQFPEKFLRAKLDEYKKAYPDESPAITNFTLGEEAIVRQEPWRPQ
jgi:hypothetical protein